MKWGTLSPNSSVPSARRKRTRGGKADEPLLVVVVHLDDEVAVAHPRSVVEDLDLGIGDSGLGQGAAGRLRYRRPEGRAHPSAALAPRVDLEDLAALQHGQAGPAPYERRQFPFPSFERTFVRKWTSGSVVRSSAVLDPASASSSVRCPCRVRRAASRRVRGSARRTRRSDAATRSTNSVRACDRRRSEALRSSPHEPRRPGRHARFRASPPLEPPV